MTKEMAILLFMALGCMLTALLLVVQWIFDDKEDKE